MTQIGETTAVATFNNGEGVCPFEPHAKEEGLTGKPPEVKSVSALKRAMTNGWTTRQWKQAGEKKFVKQEKQEGPKKERPKLEDPPIEIAGDPYPLSLSAHHIIPGKASLPVSSLKKYLWKDGGVVLGDVGYDCDGSENGIWLPTHHAMSRGLGTKIKIPDAEGMSWEQLSEKAQQAEGKATSPSELFLPNYTQQAMRATITQFHDAHSSYNEYVTKKLNKISTLLDKKIGFCEECKKLTDDEKKSPPYLLVYRLNSLSSSIATEFLQGQPTRKWLRIYTSRFSQMYARSHLTKGPTS